MAAGQEKQGMVPSMSRPANPYDNASCESFMKTLKREEIYANQYTDLEHLRCNVEEFIENNYNRRRLHSSLGYRSPKEFEQKACHANDTAQFQSVTIEFFAEPKEGFYGTAGEGDSRGGCYETARVGGGDEESFVEPAVFFVSLSWNVNLCVGLSQCNLEAACTYYHQHTF
jgi:hypothetical protein